MEVAYETVNSKPVVIRKVWVRNLCCSKPVKIRKVWHENLLYEFKLIGSIIGRYSFIAMDTEFPGQIFCPSDHRNLSTSDRYEYLKRNVDALNIIQVGLTLSDKDGNLPDIGIGNPFRYIWEFNFNDFNLRRGDQHAKNSIALLQNHGIDFDKHASSGICSSDFAYLMHYYGLVRNDSVTWITFHGAYDFGYLIKMLTQTQTHQKEEQKLLPTKLEEFLQTVKELFGNHVYDVKHMIRCCYPLCGSLDRVARALNLDRSVGESHQAGSDSRLTSQVFYQLKKSYFMNKLLVKQVGVLYGLEPSSLCHNLCNH